MSEATPEGSLNFRDGFFIPNPCSFLFRCFIFRLLFQKNAAFFDESGVFSFCKLQINIAAIANLPASAYNIPIPKFPTAR